MKKLIETGQKITPALRKTPLYLSMFFLMLFLAGISMDEPGRVLEQAMQICLRCIGVG